MFSEFDGYAISTSELRVTAEKEGCRGRTWRLPILCNRLNFSELETMCGGENKNAPLSVNLSYLCAENEPKSLHYD